MLKNLAPAIFWLLMLLVACEPNVSESLESVVPDEPANSTPAGEQKDPSDTPVETDTVIGLAMTTVNMLRQVGCNCGPTHYPSSDTLVWSTQLYEAAFHHAKDMRTLNYFGHTSPSGENVYHRLVASGYISAAGDVLSYGENIAFGDFDIQTAIQKWVASPSHCANMMRETYQEMAIAHDGNYWVQVFGAKRK